MAIRNLKEIYPDIIYTCIGRGDEENLKKLVIELNLEEQIVFLRDVPIDLKNALVAKSNVFIMPYRYPYFPYLGINWPIEIFCPIFIDTEKLLSAIN